MVPSGVPRITDVVGRLIVDTIEESKNDGGVENDKIQKGHG